MPDAAAFYFVVYGLSVLVFRFGTIIVSYHSMLFCTRSRKSFYGESFYHAMLDIERRNLV